MAIKKPDREDLLRQATALVERIELDATVSGFGHASGRSTNRKVIAGFRENGAASYFFGAEPVYQFNPAGELRRAHAGGLLFKAVHGRLVWAGRYNIVGQVPADADVLGRVRTWLAAHDGLPIAKSPRVET